MSLTPMMQQYFDVKNNYKDYILMYRLGDFYEMFFEDAYTASRELELTLTGRDCGLEDRAPMCGVPFHKADVYIGRLVEKGYKVAVCEQTEDPADAKGLVRREVVRIVTPGTITESAMLPDQKNNFLSAVYMGSKNYAVGFADITTGRIFATEFEGSERARHMINELAVYAPSEILINVSKGVSAETDNFLSERLDVLTNYEQAFRFERAAAAKEVAAQFPGYDVSGLSKEMIRVIGALLDYIRETQKTDISFIKELNVYCDGSIWNLTSIHTAIWNSRNLCARKKKKGLCSGFWIKPAPQWARGSCAPGCCIRCAISRKFCGGNLQSKLCMRILWCARSCIPFFPVCWIWSG